MGAIFINSSQKLSCNLRYIYNPQIIFLKMKMLVTGGAGFIGSWVVDYLIKAGHKVAVVDNLSTGSINNLNKKANFYKIDITDKKLKSVFEKEKPDYVFHLAAQINVRKSIQEPIEDANINILGSLNILNNCVKYGVKKIIFSSTGGAIYDEDAPIPVSENQNAYPKSPYGIAKLTVENYIKFFKLANNLDYTILRYSNVYGPRQNNKSEAGVVSIFINNIISNKECVINGTGNQTRDYIYVKDVAEANLIALHSGGTFNVGTGKEISVNELLARISSLMKKKASYKHAEAITGELLRSALDSSKLKSAGWSQKYFLDDGLKETIDFFVHKENQ